MKDVLDETNRYGDQYVQSHQAHLSSHPRARAHDFVKRRFALYEMKNFIVLIIVMGIMSFPRISHYWANRWPFNLQDSIRRIMSRDRFQLFLKFLHLSDNLQMIPRGCPGFDRLYKIRPLVNHLVTRFKSSYVPGREISIDESMISYKGRLSFLQYMPKKPTKWGVKAWVLADSASGYIWNWDLYTGKLTDDNAASGLL